MLSYQENLKARNCQVLQSVYGRSRSLRPNDSSQQIQETEEVVPSHFPKIVLLSIYNAYILERHKRQHTPGGRRKRDLLSFKEDLCVQMVGNFPQQHKSTADTQVPRRLTYFGAHFPFKGEGKNRRCVVYEKKNFLLKKTNPIAQNILH